jgi:hypothetical protein
MSIGKVEKGEMVLVSEEYETENRRQIEKQEIHFLQVLDNETRRIRHQGLDD